MKKAYQVAADVSSKVANRNKSAYNKRAGAAVLEEGDRVLVRNLREKGGPGKLRSFWENVVYKVVERRGDGPVYVVEPEKGGEIRVLHRNHLLPVGKEFVADNEDDKNKNPKMVKNEADAGVVLTFLEQFFKLYDSDNRQHLLDAYHEEAMFSPEQKAELLQSSVAGLLCANLPIEQLPSNPFYPESGE